MRKVQTFLNNAKLFADGRRELIFLCFFLDGRMG